jgi:hypothetical protein
MLCLGMHFLMQAFQDAPSRSSTHRTQDGERVCVAKVDSVGKLPYFSVTPTITYYIHIPEPGRGGGVGRGLSLRQYVIIEIAPLPLRAV